jgi:hypothetical protein
LSYKDASPRLYMAEHENLKITDQTLANLSMPINEYLDEVHSKLRARPKDKHANAPPAQKSFAVQEPVAVSAHVTEPDSNQN